MTDAKDEEQKRGERQRGLSSSDEVALKNEWNLSGAEPVVLPSPCKSAWLASVHQRLSPTVHGLWGLAWAWQMPNCSSRIRYHRTRTMRLSQFTSLVLYL